MSIKYQFKSKILANFKPGERILISRGTGNLFHEAYIDKVMKRNEVSPLILLKDKISFNDPSGEFSGDSFDSSWCWKPKLKNICDAIQRYFGDKSNKKIIVY